MALSLFMANTALFNNSVVNLSNVQIKYFDNIEVVDGLYDDYQQGRDFNTQPVFFPNVATLRRINLVPQGSGQAKVVFGEERNIQAINRGVIKVSADIPAYTSGLNKDVVVDCVKDGINFMSDWVTSQAFRNAALSAGRTAGTVAMVASRVPGAMPIALGAFALNLALNFVKDPVSVPASSGSVSMTSDIVWLNAGTTAPAEQSDVVLPIGYGGQASLQNPAKSAEYIASQQLLKESMALQIRQKALDYVSDIFQEHGEPWDLNNGLDPVTKMELDTQLKNRIADSAVNKRDRLLYGLDKGLDGLNENLSLLSNLEKLKELGCICDNMSGLLSSLNSLSDMLTNDSCCLSKEDIFEVLDKYFVPTNSINPDGWNLSDNLKQLALRPSDEVTYIDGL